MAGGSYDRKNNNSQLNPAVAYAFALQVEAAFFLPLRAVRVFSKENEFDYFQEGGMNDYVHMLRKPITKPFTFQVERYVGVDAGFLDMNSGFLDPLALGTELVLPLVLYVTRSPSGDWYKNISFTNCARAYVFTGCTVIAKEYGELNAEQSRLHTETVTIAYRELFAMNQIDPGWESGGQWEFDGTVKGKGKSHTQNRNTNVKPEVSKWNFPGQQEPEPTPSVDHTANRSKNYKPEVSKWNFPGTTEGNESVDHTANRSVNRKPDVSKWNFPGTDEQSPSVDHTANRSRNEKPEVSKWNYPGTSETNASVDHTANRSVDSKPAVSKWNYPGSGEETQSTDHTLNRNNNEKAEPVKWPPDRRALRAQALSEL